MQSGRWEMQELKGFGIESALDEAKSELDSRVSASLSQNTDETVSAKFHIKSALIASTFSQSGCHSTFSQPKWLRLTLKIIYLAFVL